MCLTNRGFDGRPVLPTADGLLEGLDAAAETGLELLRQVLRWAQPVPYLREARGHELEEAAFPRANFLRRRVVEKSVGDGVNDHDLLLDRHWLILSLLQHFDGSRATIELTLRRGIEVRRKGGERLELTILGQVEAQTTGNLSHRFDLSRAADPRYGNADVDRWAYAREEEIRLEEDLSVGDRDDVGRNVRRHVASLGLDDRERRERAAGLEDVRPIDHARVLAQLRRALEEAGVQIEHVARVGLATRWPPQHQRQLSVRGGLLRQIIVDAERRPPFVVHEVLGHRASTVRRDVLHRRRIRRRRDDDDRKLHRSHFA